MAEICPRCGLPKDLCVCDVLDKETEAKIKISTKKAKFNKFVTIVEGISADDIERTMKSLKRILACGGTYKDGYIELQGEHKLNTKNALISIGYKDTNIEIV
ncbi:MAG: stress response translation initiation inhibitor YciH [Candidatus Marsarchaeota archaeon]|jgi:translation initiation factor 1|nr:stress response translation initiation inhibitor YciH [Candidatus Marsarchaeota archaeon]MCL5418793.1 stress response translation initiation inhibitor YciH [Candidatus Marsarchaeota archaeon]